MVRVPAAALHTPTNDRSDVMLGIRYNAVDSNWDRAVSEALRDGDFALTGL